MIINLRNPIEECVPYFNNNILRHFPNIDCFIAGGSIVDYLFSPKKCIIKNDVDIFFKNIEDYNMANNIANQQSLRVRCDTPCGVQYIFTPRGNNQLYFIAHLIKKYFGTPEEILKTFDFISCAIAINKQSIITTQEFFNSLYNKELIFQNYVDSEKTAKRIAKYVRKGFEIKDQRMKDILIKYNIDISKIYNYDYD